MTERTNTKHDERVDRVRLVQRGKKETWYAEFSLDNQHCRKSLKTTNKRIARERAQQLNADLTKGSYRAAPPKLSIPTAAEQYLDTLESQGRAASTLKRYRGELEHFATWCAGKALSTLNQLTMTSYDQYRQVRRVDHTEATLAHEAVVLKQWLKWAVERGHLQENPFRAITVKKPPRRSRHVPSIEELWQLLDAASPAMQPLLMTLALTGMRSGELRRLRVEDVDRNAGWIHIVSRQGQETKTRQSRKVPLHPILLEVFNERWPTGTGFLFRAAPSSRYPDGDHSINPKHLNDRFVALVRRLKMPAGRDDGGLTIHSLRRFFETFAVNHQVPQRAVDLWLGHASDKSMGAVYYSLRDDDSQRFMRQLPFARPVR